MKWFLAVLLVFLSSSAFGRDCSETVTIDSVTYEVPAAWCGHRLDSTQVAKRSELVRLPSDLCDQDYRIYVLPKARDAFARMAAAAKKDGIKLIADSGYRSARYQREIIRRRLAAGEKPKRVLSVVAPPGYSEHETGRALDLVPSDASFAKTDAYHWLKSHAAEYGFAETYPENSGSHPREPWHWAYRSSR